MPELAHHSSQHHRARGVDAGGERESDEKRERLDNNEREGRDETLRERGDETLECDESSFWDTPVLVISHSNLPRRQSMSALLASLGFRNVSFPKSVDIDDVQEEELVLAGAISASLFPRLRARQDTDEEGIRRYVAYALTTAALLSAAAAAGVSVFVLLYK